jgi:hypothetical protein
LQALRKRFVTSRELKNDLRWLRLDSRKEISTKTVRRMLKEVNLIARKPATGPILTALHERNRLSFFLNHQLWNERHIAHIVIIALRNANIDSLERPAKSPDLNPIEHL